MDHAGAVRREPGRDVGALRLSVAGRFLLPLKLVGVCESLVRATAFAALLRGVLLGLDEFVDVGAAVEAPGPAHTGLALKLNNRATDPFITSQERLKQGL